MKVLCLLLAALLMPLEVFSWSGCATNAFVNEIRRFEEIGNTANFLRSKENYPPHKLRKLLSPVIRISNEKTGYVTTHALPRAPVYYAYFSDDRGFVSTGYEPEGIPGSTNPRGVTLEFDVTNNLRFITLKTVEIGISFTADPDSLSTFIIKDRLYPGRKIHIRWFARTDSGRNLKSLVPVIRSLSVIPGDIKDSAEPYESGIEEYDSRYCR